MSTNVDILRELYNPLVSTRDSVLTPLLGYTPDTIYGHYADDDRKQLDAVWLGAKAEDVVSELHGQARKANGARQYEITGILTIRIYCPRTDNKLRFSLNPFAQALKTAYRRYNGSVWFSNVTADGSLTLPQWNVIEIGADYLAWEYS